MQHCWLANTTGHPNAFLPYDQLREHNIRDLKYTFELLGPHASWELLGRTSAAIPTLRKIKDHVELQFNHYCRGKSHTSPDAEEDISKLVQAFHDSKVHKYTAGRKAKNKCVDVMVKGSESARITKSMDSYYEKRKREQSTDERYLESGGTGSTSSITGTATTTT
ncbi:uncharacterized protein C8Q71DRAFT_700921 [Rhodofomes roseus]|nr:uncharacterized protein C8Q71DRAFT_700921 [Rhodofomes roseus]KAH9842001.1 hypothetical protein C8Q71DRAFT_700921 [Rhodofomes roseus]